MYNSNNLSIKLMQFAYKDCIFPAAKKAPVTTSIVMIPGTVLLSSAYCVALLVDLVKDVAMASLNLLGIVLTLNDERRSSYFKDNLIQCAKNLICDVEAIMSSPIDIISNLIVSEYEIITFLYFKMLDSTCLSNFYPSEIDSNKNEPHFSFSRDLLRNRHIRNHIY